MKLAPKLALVVAVACALGSVGVAAAEAYPKSCASGRVCLYDNINYSAELGWRSAGFARTDITSGNNDKMSSWSNHTTQDGAWYSDAHGGGFCFNLENKHSNPDIGFPWNDSASSWKGNGSC
jgi:hypothetical protein